MTRNGAYCRPCAKKEVFGSKCHVTTIVTDCNRFGTCRLGTTVRLDFKQMRPGMLLVLDCSCCRRWGRRRYKRSCCSRGLDSFVIEWIRFTVHDGRFKRPTTHWTIENSYSLAPPPSSGCCSSPYFMCKCVLFVLCGWNVTRTHIQGS